MTQVAERLITDDEFARLPADPLGRRMELVCGKVVMSPPTKYTHGYVAGKLDRRLGAFAERHDLGDVTVGNGFSFTADRRNVRAPDVAFVSKARREAVPIRDDGYDLLPPDLCVEVLSPGNTRAAMAEKVALYLATGVQRVWLVESTAKRVTIHRPGRDPETLDSSATLTSDDAGFGVEGFLLPVSEIFA